MLNATVLLFGCLFHVRCSEDALPALEKIHARLDDSAMVDIDDDA